MASSEEFRVSVGVCRRRAAKDLEGSVTGVADAMGHAWRYADGVAGPDMKSILTQNHLAFADGDMVELLATLVLMQGAGLAWRQLRLGQALAKVAMDPRMHQLADQRAILGRVRLYRAVC